LQLSKSYIRLLVCRRAEEQKEEIIMDISNSTAGVYFVRIQTEAGEVIKKVMKQ